MNQENKDKSSSGLSAFWAELRRLKVKHAETNILSLSVTNYSERYDEVTSNV
jgi:hypothetical protein